MTVSKIIEEDVMTAYYEHPVGGRYQVISKIGQGGFGETYLAEDTYLHGKKCVIRVC